MTQTAPPYTVLTGISRTVMKDNQQESIENYSGNARAAEMTVNVNTNDIYIGNTSGTLNRVIQVTGTQTFLGNVRAVTAVPLAIYRSSGSRVTFPSTTTLLKLAIDCASSREELNVCTNVPSA
jgi:hypothetical protein